MSIQANIYNITTTTSVMKNSPRHSSHSYELQTPSERNASKSSRQSSQVPTLT
jgi:hypothetical protein